MNQSVSQSAQRIRSSDKFFGVDNLFLVFGIFVFEWKEKIKRFLVSQWHWPNAHPVIKQHQNHTQFFCFEKKKLVKK